MSVQTTLDQLLGFVGRGRECYTLSQFVKKYPRLWQQLLEESFGQPYPGQIVWYPNMMVVVTKSMRICLIHLAPTRVDVYD